MGFKLGFCAHFVLLLGYFDTDFGLTGVGRAQWEPISFVINDWDILGFSSYASKSLSLCSILFPDKLSIIWLSFVKEISSRVHQLYAKQHNIFPYFLYIYIYCFF